MKLADVVFTGGPSLYRAKKDRHPNVHCFPSSVDREAFRARPRHGMHEPADQADLPHPRLGFFGVIDERIDLPLLDAMAQAHPEWQIVMVGPVVKIDPAHVAASMPNIHYLDSAIRAAAGISERLGCLPAAVRAQRVDEIHQPDQNARVHGGREDDRQHADHGRGGALRRYRVPGRDAEEFIAALRKGAGRDRNERAARIERMREVLAQTSWDSTVAAMDQLIEASAIAGSEAAMARAQRRCDGNARADSVRSIVVGAGPTGLERGLPSRRGFAAARAEQHASADGAARSK